MGMQIGTSLRMFLAFTLLCGVFYPLFMTGFAEALMPSRAEGSLIKDAEGRVLGSALVGQNFTAPKYFWGRLSATGPAPYNAAASSGSNLGAANANLRAAAESRLQALRDADPQNTAPVPIDLVTASGSGLDPHISPAAAYYQLARVAKARDMDTAELKRLVDEAVEKPQLGFLGEARVNVLLLNLRLDGKLLTNE